MNEIALSVILVLVFFFSPLIISIRALKKTKKIAFLEEEINFLRHELKNLKGETFPVVNKEIQADIISDAVPEEVSVPEPIVQKTPQITVPVKRKRSRLKWKWNQERLFAFLGAFLGIIGLVFFTLYLGTRIGIFARFLIMTGFSTILLLVSFPLGKKEIWDELAHISRSFSGALFLFAVFASSTIEGLKWVDNPLFALIIIGAGTTYNLILGGFCKKKGYMVFHMAINFLVIFLLPAESLVLWLAFFITLGLQIFGYFRKEEINSSLSFLLFAVYCFYFKETGEAYFFLSFSFHIIAIITFLNLIIKKDISGILPKIVNYAMPLLWVGTAAYLGESKVLSVIPLLSGVAIGSILRIIRTKDINSLLFWPLQILVTGTFLILASGIGTSYWLTLLYMESSIFSYWMIKEKENKSVPLLLNYLILISSVMYFFLSESSIFNWLSAINNFLLLITASYFMYKASAEDEKKSKDFESLINIFQFLLPVFAFFLSHAADGSTSFTQVLFFSILCLPVLFISNTGNLKIRSYGLWFTSLLPLIFILQKYIGEPELKFSNSLIIILPLLILTLIVIVYHHIQKTDFFINPGIFVFTLILAVSLYFPFWKISTLLPGVLILAASLIYLFWWEFKNQWETQSSGLILLLLFFIRHLSHNLQIENYWGILNLRLVIEIAALIIFFLYLKSSKWKETHKIPLLNKTLQGTAFTLSWLFLLVFIFSHSNRNILSMVFQLSIIVLLFIEKRKYLPGYPLTSLAYAHFIFAQVNLALNTHPSFPFLPGILQNPWLFGFINVGTSIYIIYLFFRHLNIGSYPVSSVFVRLKKLTDLMMEKRNLTLLIPLFVSLGLFFNWTLEATALTIALFSGCFLLYGTALILKENVFRHATSLALLGTSVRLIF